jgi:hypothetical protein
MTDFNHLEQRAAFTKFVGLINSGTPLMALPFTDREAVDAVAFFASGDEYAVKSVVVEARPTLWKTAKGHMLALQPLVQGVKAMLALRVSDVVLPNGLENRFMNRLVM